MPATLTALNADNLKSLVQSLGGAEPDVSAPEVIENKLGGPSPILTFDVAAKARRSFLIARQRRPQSIVYHPGVAAWFVTYPISDTVARLGVDGTALLRSAFDLGLSYVRGVCVAPDGKSIYVSGQYRGLACVNAESLAVEARNDVQLFDAIHLSAVNSDSRSIDAWEALTFTTNIGFG